MCGIAGLIDLKGSRPDSRAAEAMARLLAHRGPDQQTLKAEGPAAFAFCRLAIIDLQTGAQPLCSEDDSVWVMLNGEIYNYVEIRKSLAEKGVVFKTQSDTEVVLRMYEIYGLDFVHSLRGMFAVSIWDKKKNRLVLARDRIGKKPLYYCERGGQFAFASEIKAFLEAPGFKPDLSREALHDYLTFLYTPGSETILEGVKKLEPAHLLVADLGSSTIGVRRYWGISPAAEKIKNPEECSEGLREVLGEAVKIRLRSDVPLGVFLSGGLDSTIITGIAASFLPGIRSFGVGFGDPRFDESAFSRMAAEAFGVRHTQEFMDADAFLPEHLRELVWYMDEPFGDSSFLPTYWIAKAARKNVTVILSGDGGDELFGGYPRYDNFGKVLALARLPSFVLSAAQKTMNAGAGAAPALQKAGKAFHIAAMPPKHRAIAMETFFGEEEKYRLYSEDWKAGGSVRSTFSRVGLEAPATVEEFSFWELAHTLPDDSLVKVDRASMACSLEVRSPFLDHKVAEFAARIPFEFKMNGGGRKMILKQAYRRMLPKKILNRKKQGFELSFSEIFQKTAWRDFAFDVLGEEKVRRRGIFDPQETAKVRDVFFGLRPARGLSRYQVNHRFWSVLIFNLWHERFFSEKRV